MSELTELRRRVMVLECQLKIHGMSEEAQKVHKLREVTGMPVLECRRALRAANGDIRLAALNMRMRGDWCWMA